MLQSLKTDVFDIPVCTMQDYPISLDMSWSCQFSLKLILMNQKCIFLYYFLF